MSHIDLWIHQQVPNQYEDKVCEISQLHRLKKIQLLFLQALILCVYVRE